MDQMLPVRLVAVHPHWQGALLLSHEDRTVEHEDVGSTGVFDYVAGRLTVTWDKFGPEIFYKCGDLFMQESLLNTLPDPRGLTAVSIAGQAIRATRVTVEVPDAGYEVNLRLGTSDSLIFAQVFVDREYDSPNLPETAQTIVDLGANIGLATLFFGQKYPQATILAVEPESANYTAMLANTAVLGTRVKPLRAAAWDKDGEINLHTESEDGVALDAWGVQVSNRPDARTVPSHTVGTLMDKAGFTRADILKVDIEGAELEVFAGNAAAWLHRVDLIIVETHDRFRPGSDAALRDAIAGRFEELPPQGENLFFRRLADFAPAPSLVTAVKAVPSSVLSPKQRRALRRGRR